MLDTAGALTQHMATHIVAMNIFAPACAAGWLLLRNDRGEHGLLPIFAATVLQMSLLWTWHAPGILAASHGGAVATAMLSALFLAAFWFWLTVMQQARRAAWPALAALLISGKLFCLLGVLLTFAPRTLYPQAHHAQPSGLEDQQLAGLLMLVACPVVYIAAATIIARRWLATIERDRGWQFRRGTV